MSNKKARMYAYLSAEITSLYHEAAVKMGISDTVLNILYVLCERDGQCLQSDIFRLTGISRQTINSAIRKLEKDGFAYLKQGEGRNTMVCLTEKGKDFSTFYLTVPISGETMLPSVSHSAACRKVRCENLPWKT
mgnify:CR=1 FL=1